ncbi:MAG: response regulator transcription factor [Eubacterium sp.]|nr:response regulator transcription factor [Eubacterium sp.]
MKKVLVAEDEESIREFIVINLTRSGYDVEQAENGAVALEKFSKNESSFDVAILDIMMPEVDGLTVCKELRKRSSELGIIMLSAKTQEMDKVTGLLFGADDYVTKPFSPSELMARVDAVYRRVEMTRGFRQNDTTGDSIQLEEFELSLRNRTLTKNNEPIELTQVEFQIIEYFFKNPNAALSRTDILKTVWGSNYFGDEKIVDVNVRRLRMKIEDNPSNPTRLVTIWGLGYKWVVNNNN